MNQEDESRSPRIGAETRCHGCGYRGLARGGLVDCPTCGNGLFYRAAPRVTPLSHAGALLAAVFSLRGLLFAGFYALLVLAPLPFSDLIAYGLLCTASIQLAWKTMSAQRDRIEFPEIDFNLFELRWVVPVIVFSGFFLIAPAFLLGLGISTESPPIIAAAVAVYAFAPAALLGYLRHGSVLGFFVPDTGWSLLRRDALGLLGLSLAFLGVIFGGLGLDAALSSTILGSALGSAVWAVALLYAFGLCGLFLRKHSRALDLDLDHDEWAPIQVVTVSAPRSYASTLTARDLISYPSVPMHAPAKVEIDRVPYTPQRGLRALPVQPVIKGELIDAPAKERPAPIDLDWLPPSQGGEL